MQPTFGKINADILLDKRHRHFNLQSKILCILFPNIDEYIILIHS